MDSYLQDLVFGLRILRKSPGISFAVVVALALGIGANTAMFSVVNATFLQPLPYQNPDRLMLVWERDPKGTIYGAAAANFLDLAAQSRSTEAIAAWAGQDFVFTGTDRPERFSGAAVTANFFSTLGVKPLLGRPFLPGEDGLDRDQDQARVAVISYRLWQDQFGGDPNILGRYLKLNNAQYAVVGVMRDDFQFVNKRHQVWVPISIDRYDRNFHYLMVVARLRESESLTGVSTEMQSIVHRLGQEYAKTNRGWTAQVDQFQEWLVRGNFKKSLILLFGAVGLVLLIACVNIANLLLARSAAREREIAIRAALGAPRSRIVRQLLTESVLLAILGGAAGLAIAAGLVSVAPKILPPSVLPAVAPIRISSWVLLFTLAVSLLTGIVFGLAPALQSSRPNLQGSLKEGARGTSSGRSRRHFRNILVVAETAIALMLLIGAGLMLESLRRLTSSNLGFDPRNVLTFNIFLPVSKYSEPQQVVAFYHRLLERIRTLPGVQSAASSSNLPLLRVTIMKAPFELEGEPIADESQRPDVTYVTASSDYLRTLGIRLKRGRALTEADTETSTPWSWPTRLSYGATLRTATPSAVTSELTGRCWVRPDSPIWWLARLSESLKTSRHPCS